MPWSELSGGQKAGRIIAITVLGLSLMVVFRTLLRSVIAPGGGGSNAPVAQNEIPLTEADRKDGIQSLCKVFEIYGLPHNDQDAVEAARNAGELFKLAGNQSVERSSYILGKLAQQFRGGELKPHDCADAGVPLNSSDAAETAPPPDAQAPVGAPAVAPAGAPTR